VAFLARYGGRTLEAYRHGHRDLLPEGLQRTSAPKRSSAGHLCFHAPGSNAGFLSITLASTGSAPRRWASAATRARDPATALPIGRPIGVAAGWSCDDRDGRVATFVLS
jgi:hypothetical protein